MHAAHQGDYHADLNSADPLQREFIDYDPAQSTGSRSRQASIVEHDHFNNNNNNTHSVGQGYSHVADHSEPGSPIPLDAHSNESGSSGTKVDPSNPRYRETMSSEGSYDNRQSALLTVSTFHSDTNSINWRVLDWRQAQGCGIGSV